MPQLAFNVAYISKHTMESNTFLPDVSIVTAANRVASNLTMR